MTGTEAEPGIIPMVSVKNDAGIELGTSLRALGSLVSHSQVTCCTPHVAHSTSFSAVSNNHELASFFSVHVSCPPDEPGTL